MTHTIHIRQNTETGNWTVEQHKDAGINKGVTILAVTCGGMLGQRLAMQIASWTCRDLMADHIVFCADKYGMPARGEVA
jgi:hypothetical protein